MPTTSDAVDHTIPIEIDIWIKATGHKVIVLERNLLELQCDGKQGIVNQAHGVEHLVRDLLHDLAARVKRLVHAVPKPHEAKRVFLVLGARDKLRDAVNAANLLQHLQHGLIGATMGRTPQRSDAAGHTGEGVGL